MEAPTQGRVQKREGEKKRTRRTRAKDVVLQRKPMSETTPKATAKRRTTKQVKRQESLEKTNIYRLEVHTIKAEIKRKKSEQHVSRVCCKHEQNRQTCASHPHKKARGEMHLNTDHNEYTCTRVCASTPSASRYTDALWAYIWGRRRHSPFPSSRRSVRAA